jgi:autophagy-related protein 9
VYRHAPAPSAGFYDNNNKMEQSFLHFKAAHPDWQPSDPSSSVFLDKLMSDNPAAGAPHGRSLHASVYNRGLGLSLGMGHGHGPSAGPAPGPGPQSAGPGSRWFQPAELATMNEREPEEETEDGDEGEAEAMGWNRHMDADSGESAHEGRGLLRDAGILLNQVMNR